MFSIEKLEHIMARLFSLLSLLACLLFVLPAWAQFAGGSGTANDPYLVADAIQLSSVRYYPTCNFLQIADIDLNVYPYNQGIGWQSMTFSGVYDGGNHQIANLMINRPGSTFYNGLFDGAQELKNINLTNFTITGGVVIGGLAASLSSGIVTNCCVSGSILGEGVNFGTAGGLVGGAWGNNVFSTCQANVVIVNVDKGAGLVGDFGSYDAVSTLSNCSTSGSVTAQTAAGLTVSMRNGQVSGCSSTCSVVATYDAAGLVVSVSGVAISGCNATGSVTTTGIEGDTGGLIASAFNSQLVNCYATGAVHGSSVFGNLSGGLLGSYSESGVATTLELIVNRCYAKGNVYGWKAGGLVGGLTSYNEGVAVSNCYARGNVEAYAAAGGFVGDLMSSDSPEGAVQITNCYCTGNAVVQLPWGNGGFGGDIYGQALVSGCYWNSDNSTNSSDFYDLDLPGITGITTSQMIYPQSVTTFAAWDFQFVWSHDIDYTHNYGYPYLETDTPGTVAAITFNPPAGSYNNPFYFSMACPTSFSHIYYTLDGSEPSEASMEFVAELVIAHNTTVKARAYRNNWEPSEICTATYTFPGAAEDELIPASKLVLSAYPNPFTHQLNLTCKLPKSSDASLQIYNLKGQLVREFTWENLSVGLQSIQWDGFCDNGIRASNGMYLCKLQAVGQVAVCRVMLIR